MIDLNSINFSQVFVKIPEPIGPMINITQAKYIVDELINVLNIDGDVVELGCNVGTTTIYLQSVLDIANSEKNIHVYDSFEGLPDKNELDNIIDVDIINKIKYIYKKGSCKTTRDSFENTFVTYGLKLPVINEGWFSEIPDEKYPDKICFAFFDGDFYSSILDSFEKVYNKVVPGGVILIHDYNFPPLPGVKKACEDFLKDKPEKIIYNGICVGKLIKQ